MKMLKTKKIYISRKFRNYLIVGGGAFAGEYVSFLIILSVVDSLVVAQTASFTVGLLISFLGNRNVTFNGKTTEYALGRGSQLWRYIVLALCNLVLSNVLIHIIAQYMPAVAAKLFVMGLVVLWNYIIFNKIIFKAQ